MIGCKEKEDKCLECPLLPSSNTYIDISKFNCDAMDSKVFGLGVVDGVRPLCSVKICNNLTIITNIELLPRNNLPVSTVNLLAKPLVVLRLQHDEIGIPYNDDVMVEDDFISISSGAMKNIYSVLFRVIKKEWVDHYTILSPNEFTIAMMNHSEKTDKKLQLSDMTKQMCNLLRSMGYGDGIDIFEDNQN